MKDGFVSMLILDDLERALVFAKEHLEALTDVVEADAGTLLVGTLGGRMRRELGILGRDGVLGGEEESGSILAERDVDISLRIIHQSAMFEAVLNHRL